jgi:hypothetical protein
VFGCGNGSSCFTVTPGATSFREREFQFQQSFQHFIEFFQQFFKLVAQLFWRLIEFEHFA